MGYDIEITYEDERKCGFRHSGPDGVGLYIMGGSAFEPCERLPWKLTVCPCCGGGIKFSRGFTWIDPMMIFDGDPRCMVNEDNPADENDEHRHERCTVCHPELIGHQAGLLWVGEKNYSPEQFAIEAMRMGVSRRIPSVPNDFEIGKHVIYLAHVKAIPFVNDEGKMDGIPGIFMVFKPTRIDIVVDVETEEELPERAKHIKDRLGDNARIVKVVPLGAEAEEEGERDE